MNYADKIIRKMAFKNMQPHPAQQPPVQQIVRPGGSQTIQGIDPYWFSALRPVMPTAPPSYRPRQWPFLPGFNIVWEPRGEDTGRIPFDVLKRAAEEWELWRIVMKTVTDKIATMEWQIRSKKDPGAPEARVPSQADPVATELEAVFQYPDGVHNTEQWFRMLLKDMYVLDAATIFCEIATNGVGCMPGTDIKSFMPIDGSTIKVLIDDMGRRPQGVGPDGQKDAAFQQVVYGLPAVQFTEDDIIYAVQNPSNRSAYGTSYLEDCLIWANIGIRSQQFILDFYTSGNTPEMLLGVDATQPAQKIEEWQEMLDTYLSGQLAERRKIKMIPAMSADGKLNAVFPKEPLLKSDIDEWLARIVCVVLGMNPQAFVKTMNRATGESQQDQAEAEGQAPVIKWLENVVNECLTRMGYGDDYEFTFRVRREQDGTKQMNIDTGYMKMGVFTVNMVLEDLGLDIIDEDWADAHLAWTPNGPIPLDMVSNGEMLQQPGGATAQPQAPQTGKQPPKAQKAEHRSELQHVEDALAAKFGNKFKEARAELIEYLRRVKASRKED